MKPVEHYQDTAVKYGRVTGALAVLPDIGVAAQRLPGMRVKRWGAVLHHDERTLEFLGRHGPAPVARAWTEHFLQDEQTHPEGTYRPAENAGLPADLAVAYSGGPDSFIVWRLLGCPQAVYVHFGNKSAAAELDVTARAWEKFGPQDVDNHVHRGPPLPELDTGWIPYRNLHIILHCAIHSPGVVLARIAEWGPDKNPAFFRRVERLLASSRGGRFQAAQDLPKVRIYTPAGHLTKTQLVRRYLQEFGRGADDDLKRYTRSCYAGRPDGKWCGECGACFCRWVAFTNNGIDESDRYVKVPSRLDYYKRLHPADIRPSMVPMYVKRAREMRGYA